MSAPDLSHGQPFEATTHKLSLPKLIPEITILRAMEQLLKSDPEHVFSVRELTSKITEQKLGLLSSYAIRRGMWTLINLGLASFVAEGQLLGVRSAPPQQSRWTEAGYRALKMPTLLDGSTPEDLRNLYARRQYLGIRESDYLEPMSSKG